MSVAPCLFYETIRAEDAAISPQVRALAIIASAAAAAPEGIGDDVPDRYQHNRADKCVDDLHAIDAEVGNAVDNDYLCDQPDADKADDHRPDNPKGQLPADNQFSHKAHNGCDNHIDNQAAADVPDVVPNLNTEATTAGQGQALQNERCHTMLLLA